MVVNLFFGRGGEGVCVGGGGGDSGEGGGVNKKGSVSNRAIGMVIKKNNAQQTTLK